MQREPIPASDGYAFFYDNEVRGPGSWVQYVTPTKQLKWKGGFLDCGASFSYWHVPGTEE